MMTRKDYKMVANEIKYMPDQLNRGELAKWLANRFALNNPRFDKDKFLKSCDIGNKAETKG